MSMHRNLEEKLIIALRVSLGLIFLWFGLIKVAGYQTVYHIIKASFPMLATGRGYMILGLVEAVIGLGLITNVCRKLTHIALVLHLLGTLTVFLVSPQMMFQPYFPILTLEGEFVVKNITLLAAGLVTMMHQKNSFTSPKRF